tara:strand:+ start:8143 stop:8826 length:684 start_codon:yes stop_codon:yes gene_type:complete
LEEDKNVLAIITARGGSKGLKNKNIKKANGKPLIAWTIDAALKSTSISKVILSSDCKDIINVAKKYHCEAPFIRPNYLSTDRSTSVDVVKHALKKIQGFKYFILLQPTSPLRTAGDIDNAFKLMKQKGAPSCISIRQSRESPLLMYSMDKMSKINPLIKSLKKINRRQDLPKFFMPNGAIYISDVKHFLKSESFITNDTLGYLMPESRSLDIDDKKDFDIFKRLVES